MTPLRSPRSIINTTHHIRRRLNLIDGIPILQSIRKQCTPLLTISPDSNHWSHSRSIAYIRQVIQEFGLEDFPIHAQDRIRHGELDTEAQEVAFDRDGRDPIGREE